MKTLLQYLADLAKDPVAQEAFKKDPEAAIASSGLSEQDQQVLRSRNNAMIQAAVGKQAVDAMIYATPAPMVYATPPMIYAMVPMIYGQAPMIYAQPPMIYAQPPMIYAQPSMIYAPGTAQPAMIYSPATKPDDEK